MCAAISNSDTYIIIYVLCVFSRRPGRARVRVLAKISRVETTTTTTTTMKTADADPYEFFRWKSSCGRLVVRTTWVSGVRHVLLSDDDDKSPEKEKPLLQVRRRRADVPAADRGTQNSRTVDDVGGDCLPQTCNAADDDNNYVERVLQWLQKPSAELYARRKPMSAPGGDARGFRRPALVKTCSIPERHRSSERRQSAVVHDERSTTTTRRSGAKSQHKTELHVHMPSVLQGGNSQIDHDYE